jgi:hypothetical protein
MARFDGAFWESFEAIRPQNAVPFFFAKNTSPCTSLQRPCKRKLFSETAAKIKAKLSFLSLFEKNT